MSIHDRIIQLADALQIDMSATDNLLAMHETRIDQLEKQIQALNTLLAGAIVRARQEQQP